MKSPMNMAPFKLKSAPVNMNTPGSVAKLAGVSPMKTKGLRKDLKDQGFKRTGESEVTKTLNAKELAEYKARNKK